jgi:hypothetical protein
MSADLELYSYLVRMIRTLLIYDYPIGLVYIGYFRVVHWVFNSGAAWLARFTLGAAGLARFTFGAAWLV